MKIAVAGFQHETNRFAPFTTSFDDFVRQDGWPGLTEGDAVISVFRPANIPIGGFLKLAESRQIDTHPILWANAEPAGLVQDDAFDRISERILDGLEAAGSIDGIYLDLHGAMVCESFEDGEGELLKRVRDFSGTDIPIAVSLDLHANVTLEMAQLSDVMTIYRTYPHIDMAATGYRAGELLIEMISAGRKPFCALRKPPFVMPLHTQCTDMEPARSLYRLLPEDNSLSTGHADIALGFPQSDIAEIGPAIVAYDYRESGCQDRADSIYEKFTAEERHFHVPVFSAQDAVRLAQDAYDGSRPVVLAEINDNSGAGGTADTTVLLSTLAASSVQNCAYAAICDPNAVELAHSAGVGSEFSCALGDKFSDAENPGYRGRFRVATLSDGRFKFRGEMMSGITANIGKSAALDVLDSNAELRVIVTSERIQCVDRALFSHLGIIPEEMAVLAIKSVVHFRADFEPIATEIFLTEGEGCVPSRFEPGTFPHLRTGVRLL